MRARARGCSIAGMDAREWLKSLPVYRYAPTGERYCTITVEERDKLAADFSSLTALVSAASAERDGSAVALTCAEAGALHELLEAVPLAPAHEYALAELRERLMLRAARREGLQ